MIKLHNYFNFGKYSGMRVSTVCEIDPNYIFWCMSNTDYTFSSEVYRSARAHRKLIRSQGKPFF